MRRPRPLARLRGTLTAPMPVSRVSAGMASARMAALDRVDVSSHNARGAPPSFYTIVSQVVSAAQFSHPDFERLVRLVAPDAASRAPHRKNWEFVYVLRAAEQAGRLEPGRRALGFGVGREPIPAALARYGLSVLATDLDIGDEQSGTWSETGQHMSGLDALSRPDLVTDEELARLVSTRYVDMNDVPGDLGRFDLVWSCCAFEHLGSPEAGLEFVVNTLDLLEPGGVSVHTTELELTVRDETADYGHLAVYRVQDLDRLAARIRDLGFEMETNWYVSMDTPADRWIALHPYPNEDPAHLKLAIVDSVSTSAGLLIRRPA